MKTIKLIYHGTVLSKKNRHIITRSGGIIPDAKAKACEEDMIKQFLPQLKKQGGTRIFTMTKSERIAEATANGTTYHIKMMIWNETNRRRDLDNQATSILDALTGSGAIADDCSKYVRAILVIYGGIDKDDPRAEITIGIHSKEEEGGTVQA